MHVLGALLFVIVVEISTAVVQVKIAERRFYGPKRKKKFYGHNTKM